MSKFNFWCGKQIFLTGHTGFKGTWLCKIFEILGANVTGYALSPPDKANIYELCKPQINSIIGDIRDFDALFTAFRAVNPEIVIHMAAQPLVLDSYCEPRYTYDVNVMGTVNILECLRLNDSVKSMLNVTTDKVYLNQERVEGYNENEQLNGYDPYANSKSCSDLVTSSYYNAFLTQKRVAVSTARSGNVIGGGDFAANRLIPDCARTVAKSEIIKIRNPNSVRPYLHVLDSLFGYLNILESQYNDPSLSGAYNIGPAESGCTTNRNLVNLFCKAWGSGADWEHIPVDTPHESTLLSLNCSKIMHKLGWSPRWDVECAVRETALWYKSYYTGGDFNSVMAKQIGGFVK